MKPDTVPPSSEGGRHLRLGGAPALTLAAPARAGLGRADADAARERAGRLGLRAGIARAWRAARRDPPSCRLRPDRIHAVHRLADPHATRDPPHASRARGRLRAPRRHRRRAFRCASRRSTGSTSFARLRTSASPTARSQASRTCTSRSRAAWRATSKTSRASPTTASRSSTTGSTRTASRSRTRAAFRACCASGA